MYLVTEHSQPIDSVEMVLRGRERGREREGGRERGREKERERVRDGERDFLTLRQ